ncbi:RDD family protein [Noviluteimonas gilva]|uniref:RDD family protein n=1 Tax=Noviluteimonas gilva TaxID=2682097 RepID=A0A7C9HL56_9GAMM|nr:RDD family protein [Lysobacter gilvus]MUV13256.1 RDD family protein [Lysobacter gilvus]
MQDTNGVNPYAAPGARIEQTYYATEEFVLAGRGKRLAAQFLDVLIYAVAIGLAAVPTAMISDATGSKSSVPFIAIAVVLGLIIGIVNLVQLYKTGQTIAKRWLGIRIVRSDGSRAGLGRIVALRSLVPGLIGAIPLVGPLFSIADPLFIFADDRRTLHDKIADTIVVDV